MPRSIPLILNSIVVLVSLVFFSYTFFAKEHLREHTRTFVAEKTTTYTAKTVAITKTALNSPLSGKLISKEQRALIEEEIRLYESDPVDYVTSLTSEKKPSFGEGKAAEIKRGIHAHYQSILTALIVDLRIFSGTNVVAGAIAIILLLLPASKRSKWVIAFTFVIFAAAAYGTVSYLGGISFMNILFKWHMGWSYPLGIALTIIGMLLEYGLHKKSDDVELAASD